MSDYIFDLNEDELVELQGQYPYSALITLVLNRKKLNNFGSIHFNDIIELINKTDNPGLAISSVFESESLDDVSYFNDLMKEEVMGGNTGILEKQEESDQGGLNSDLNERIASEKLAEIYRQQGLNKEADEIYHRISLNNKNK